MTAFCSLSAMHHLWISPVCSAIPMAQGLYFRPHPAGPGARPCSPDCSSGGSDRRLPHEKSLSWGAEALNFGIELEIEWCNPPLFPSCAKDHASIRLHDIFCLAQECSELPMTNSRVMCLPRINQFFFPCGQSATSGTKVQNADSFIFATRLGFATNYVAFVIITRTKASNGISSLQTPADRQPAGVCMWPPQSPASSSLPAKRGGKPPLSKVRGGLRTNPPRGQPDSCIRNSLSALKYQCVVGALSASRLMATPPMPS
jgi:hypothetical protein